VNLFPFSSLLVQRLENADTGDRRKQVLIRGMLRATGIPFLRGDTIVDAAKQMLCALLVVPL
jgi:hypothetical protein